MVLEGDIFEDTFPIWIFFIEKPRRQYRKWGTTIHSRCCLSPVMAVGWMPKGECPGNLIVEVHIMTQIKQKYQAPSNTLIWHSSDNNFSTYLNSDIWYLPDIPDALALLNLSQMSNTSSIQWHYTGPSLGFWNSWRETFLIVMLWKIFPWILYFTKLPKSPGANAQALFCSLHYNDGPDDTDQMISDIYQELIEGQ